MDKKEQWITVNGNHIPIKEGQTKEEAVENFLKVKNKFESESVSAVKNEKDLKNLGLTKKTQTSNNKKTFSKEEFYGKEIVLKKGERPVDVLLKHKEGHIKNAFYRKEMGFIDLVWGTNGKHGAGLWHLIERRDEMFQNGKGKISGIDMAKKIPEILEKGSLVEDNQNRFNYEYQDYRVGVKPSYDGEKVNWIVSAMEIL